MTNVSAERCVILVPSGKDIENPLYRRTYWPNFIAAVREALARAEIDCRIAVVGEVDRIDHEAVQ